MGLIVEGIETTRLPKPFYVDGRGTFSPMPDRMFVGVLSLAEYKVGGLIVPGTVSELIPPQQGVIIRTGRNIKGFQPGEKVLFPLGAGTELEGVVILRSGDVLCKIEG